MNGMENSEKWSDHDVQALLALYATEEVQSGLEGCTRNLKIFGKVAAGELAHIGCRTSRLRTTTTGVGCRAYVAP